MYKFICVLLCVFPMMVSAGGVAKGFSVTKVRVDKSGKGIVTFDAALLETPPACGSAHPQHFAFDTNTPGGSGILALVLSAQAAGKKVWASGTGACDIYGGAVESWNWGDIR